MNNYFRSNLLGRAETGYTRAINVNKTKKFINNMEIALAKYKNDNTHKANFLCIGDSSVEGAGASAHGKKHVSLLSNDIMTRQYGSSADEYTYYPAAAYPTGNIAFTAFTGTWAHINNAYSTVGEGTVTSPSDTLTGTARGWLKTTTNGSTMTIASFGYKLKILFASDGVFAEEPGQVSYSVNGGAAVNVNLAGSTKYKWIEIDPGGSYDVVFTANTTGGKSVACQVLHYVGNLAGLKVINFACGGSGSYHWAQRLNIIDAYEPIVSLVTLGGNDIAHSKTDSEYELNMRSIITKLLSHGDTIVGFYSPWVTADTGVLSSIERFRKIAERVSLDLGAFFIDYHNVFIDGATADTNGLLADTIHPDDDGYEVKYQYVKSKIYY